MGEMGRVVGVAGGAVGLGGFAAALGLCCGAPWAVALLGVAGAIAVARLEFLLPHTLAGAAMLLVLGFWLAYGPRSACLRGTCERSTTATLHWIIWIAAALVGAFSIIAMTGRI